MRLPRPYIPLSVRVQVAERQAKERIGCAPFDDYCHLGLRLSNTLATLFGSPKNVELHHRPSLCNRPWNAKTQDYDPPANDPEHLVYVRKEEHGIETRVRGQGAQRSDLGQRRYLKKLAKNRAKDKKRPGRWPKRKLRSKPINASWRRSRRPKQKPLGSPRSAARRLGR